MTHEEEQADFELWKLLGGDLHDVVSVTALDDYCIHIVFDDGAEGDVDMAWLIGERRGMFQPLDNPDFFAQVFVDPESRVVAWPGDLDFDSEVLYGFATHAIVKLYPAGHPEFRTVAEQWQEYLDSLTA